MKPDKIINVVTGKQSLRVVGECIVGNIKDKKHKKEALPLEWDSKKKNKDSRRQGFVDEEAVLNQLRAILTKSGHSWPVAWRTNSCRGAQFKKRPVASTKEEVTPTWSVYHKARKEASKVQDLEGA